MGMTLPILGGRSVIRLLGRYKYILSATLSIALFYIIKVMDALSKEIRKRFLKR